MPSASSAPPAGSAVPAAGSAVPADRSPAPRIWPGGVVAAAGYFAAGAVLMLLQANVATFLPGAGLPGPPWDWFAYLLLGCIGLLFRSANVPLMLALTVPAAVLCLLADAGVAGFLLAFEAIYSGILYGRPRLSRIVVRVAQALAAILVVVVAASYRDVETTVLATVQALVVFLMPVWWAGDLRAQRDRTEDARARAEAERRDALHAREVAALKLELAVTEERARMARELHDSIAGHLSAIALQSGAAAAAADPALTSRVLGQVRAESLRALEQMRSMIDVLESRDGRGLPVSGQADLADLAGSAAAAGTPVRITGGQALPDQAPAALRSGVFRIVQEALTNCIRHAPGREVLVRLGTDDGGALLLEVANSLAPDAPDPRRGAEPQPDPGPGEGGNAGEDAAGADAGGADADGADAGGAGAAVGINAGSGIRNMKLRAARLGGTLTAGAEDGLWRVAARLPLTEGPQ